MHIRFTITFANDIMWYITLLFCVMITILFMYFRLLSHLSIHLFMISKCSVAWSMATGTSLAVRKYNCSWSTKIRRSHIFKT